MLSTIQQNQHAHVQQEMAHLRREIQEIKMMLGRLRPVEPERKRLSFSLFPRRGKPPEPVIVQEPPKPSPGINLEQVLPLLPQLSSIMPEISKVMPKLSKSKMKDTMQILSNPAVANVIQQILGNLQTNNLPIPVKYETKKR
ncbi:hypothetical protein [Brevibacillus laterosporus]|uniref:hypothetical protein n=3 Tax=Brevibacillus laterosporus TaxID=1465 RepID=UPI0004CF3C61|nr:hypothetical protein [Brevibacillus laterosporus]AYK06453.1 hypothetical protein D8Z77_08660 [Brevibacillus laterosporus]MCR8997733.1 hypothetical protein [Brevibacillus laterosporus]